MANKSKKISGPHSVPQPRKERGESYRLMRRRIEQAGGPLNFLASEWDRKHPQSIQFVELQEVKDDAGSKTD